MEFIDIAKALMWLGLAILFAAGGLASAYALWRTGRVLKRVEQDLHRTVDEVVPIIAKASVSMDQVNSQLGKVDLMMDSAVDATEAIDTTVRAVSHAVTEPVKIVSSAMSGATETVRSFHERVANSTQYSAANASDSGDPFDHDSAGDVDV